MPPASQMPIKDKQKRNASEQQRRRTKRAEARWNKINIPREGAREEVVSKIVCKIITTVKAKAARRKYAKSRAKANPDAVKEKNRILNEKRKLECQELKVTQRQLSEIKRSARSSQPSYNDTERKRVRYNTNPQFQLRCKISVRIAEAMKNQCCAKANSVLKYIDCTLRELKQHMRARSIDGVLDDKEVDHIFPISMYNLSTEADNAMHWTNLQMLTRSENAEKQDRLPTKDMAARVPRSRWPSGITEEMLPLIYEGWHSSMHKHAMC